MTAIALRNPAISAVTLFVFTLTTLSPGLAWATQRAELQGTTRVVDETSPDQLKAARTKPDLPVTEADASSLAEEKPSKHELQAAIAGKSDKTAAAEPAAPPAAAPVETAALPTGGDKSGVTSQSISVPKGSGTVQGMGESFSAQLSTGIATFSVPFALPAARGGAQPSLGLSYSSGSGAGLAGMGWSVGVPYIARQTDRGLPAYEDKETWHANQDRFVFNGGQELVPICTVDDALACKGKLAEEVMPPWSADHQYFRPRVEGSFLRFFWSPNHKTWRVQDKSGVTMELGEPLDGGTGADHLNSLEVNPSAPTQIFRWHLARQYDTYGNPNPATGNPTPVNVVVYKYFQDGGQAYVSDIYDTTPSATPNDTAMLSGFAHHTHINYEARTDPTETYHSGWLIKQTQRVAGVDVTSKPSSGSGAARRQVRRYHLEYDKRFHTSYLTSVQVEGRCDGSEGSDGVPAESNERLGDTSCAKLPPMTFDYSHVRGFNTAGTAIESGLAGYEAFDARIQQVGGDPPHSVDEELTDYFDINADGLPDLLVTAPGIYGNDYGVFFNSEGGVRNTFGTVSQMGVAGVLGANSGTIKLSNANVAPLDVDGDGIIDFLHMPKVKTYAVYKPALVGSKWMLRGRSIDVANRQSPKVDLGKDAAETRIADVNFDGMVDLVVSTGTEFQTFLSLGRLPDGDGQFGKGKWATNATSSLSNDPIAKCVPFSGTPVRFSDSDIQLADMNGDGIQDIVRVRRGDLRYWPGRGNGFWGTGELDDCPAGTFGDKRYVTMDGAPFYSDIQGTSLRMDDVNGDGLDDLVQVRFDAVDVWLNVDGKGWTQRSIIDGTTASPSYANRVRLMDINGSGTRDIVWGNGKKYEFIDLAGGERPGLLVSVKNGLGKSTEIEYASSTQEMLAAERTGVDCAGELTPFDSKWCSKMPTVTHLVKRVTESDNLSVAGSGISKYVTEYSYRDPVYEGRQREFRGFRRARSKRLGDVNSPTDLTESTFLLGECEDETPDNGVDDCSLSERWRDNPKEALKGLPVVTEHFDESGRYASTEASTYRLRELYLGLDGRHVRHAFESGKRSVHYDTAIPNTQASFGTLAAAQVELEIQAPQPTYPVDSDACVAPAEATTPSHATPVPLRATTGHAITESAAFVDAFGNAYLALDRGCVGGDATVCPQTTQSTLVGNDPNEALCSFTIPALLSDAPSHWLYRTVASWANGSAQSAPRHETLTTYSAEGAPKQTRAVFLDTATVIRSHPNGNAVQALAPATASTNGTRIVGERVYDEFGNVTQETGPDGLGRCRAVSYDVGIYKQLPLSETVYSGGCNSGGLTTYATYDRGLGLVTSVQDLNDQKTTVAYDGFGRLTSLVRPRPDGSAIDATTLASVKIDYSLPSPQDPRAYSVIHTQTQDGPTLAASEYLESYSYVDGMGRARVGLAEADPDEDGGNHWIISSIAHFDAKGAVQRKYLPSFLQNTPTGFPVADAPPNTQYGRQRYDAFGRQVQTFDVDGTVSLQSRYHALSTDLYDAADLYPGPHQGTYASTRTDGHGRTVETTERAHDSGALDLRYVRTKFLPTGEPTVISRVHAGSPTVMRWMRYDTLGRMVLNVEPHTTANFKTDLTTAPSSQTGGMRPWIYQYNDAGDLVATSDARGCGQNFFYDGAGRLYGEDYSPCNVYHWGYTAPNVGTKPYDVTTLTPAAQNAFEVFYQYDSVPSAPVASPPAIEGYPATSDANKVLKGKLAAVHDRAATTWFAYDALGRTTKTFRQVANVGAVNYPTFASRLVNHWYHKNFYYDAADRSIEETTGVVSPELQSTGGTSSVTTKYTHRGTIQGVGSSYGELVKKITRTADGLVTDIALGDKADTTTHSDFDSRRRLRSVQTYRGFAPQWSSSPATISPEPGANPEDPTRQLLLQDLDYSYDVVGNPTEIRDWRTPDEWPAGAKPVTRRMAYDDLNRVTRVDYEYPAGSDAWKSPHAADMPTVGDPRRPKPNGMRTFANRPLWQTYKYDWLGNTTFTDDDQHALLDRSLGKITSNATTDATKPRPYQFYQGDSVPGATAQIVKAVAYDDAGNLTWFTSGRNAVSCTLQTDCQNLQWFYTYDEVGRLYAASKVNSGFGETPYNPQKDTLFVYDYNDERVAKQFSEYNYQTSVKGPLYTTLYVFDSLEVRRTVYDPVAKQYPVDSTTEVAYLSANGMRLARLHYEQPEKGEPRLAATSDQLHAPNLHVLLDLPDHLGSSSMIVDHGSGELVEARTYQPYGATESDYRPDRWKGFREDYGFTGKEEDLEAGVIYFGKRYLSAFTGRWMSADPLAVHSPGKADLNLYAYVRGQILKAVDPIGLECGKDADCASTTGEEKTQTGDEENMSVGAPDSVSSGPIRVIPKSALLAARKTDALMTEYFGESARDLAAQLSPAEHALEQHGPGGPTPYLSASLLPRGPEHIDGQLEYIDVDRAVKSGAEYISEEDLSMDADRLQMEKPNLAARVRQWMGNQGNEREVLFKGNIPASAIVTPGGRGVIYLGRGLAVVGVAVSAYDVGTALAKSVDKGSPRPIAAESLRQIGGWGGAYAGGLAGAEGAALLGLPVGGVGAGLTGLGGALVGGYLGYKGGDYLADPIDANF